MVKIIGFVDCIERNRVGGWVINVDSPSERLVVELRSGERVIVAALASVERPDLAAMNFGRSDFAFTLVCPNYVDLDVESMAVFVSGSSVPLPYAEAGSRHEGVLEAVSNTRIGGWAWLPSNPLKRPWILFQQAGRTVARVQAKDFRQDLLDASLGDGCYAFDFNPHGIAGLKPEEIEALVEGTDQVLHDMRGPRPNRGATRSSQIAAAPAPAPPAATVAPPPPSPPPAARATPLGEAPAPPPLSPELIAALRGALPFGDDNGVL